jgi:hypothetical protein
MVSYLEKRTYFKCLKVNKPGKYLEVHGQFLVLGLHTEELLSSISQLIFLC